MHPFMAEELPFDLRIGLLPLVRTPPIPRTSSTPTEPVSRGGQGGRLTRTIGAFTRFLEAISFSHGGQLNVSAVARECEVERKVVAGYVGILEDLLLAFRLPSSASAPNARP